MRFYLTGAIIGLAVAGAAGLLWTLGGFVNVAATHKEPAALIWLLHTTYEQSVQNRAKNIDTPKDLGRSGQMLRGARSFAAMCSGCHTPPGESRTPVSQGLNPPPPDLPDLLSQRTAAEAFWVVKHGVRMTGMPAFGPTHDDKELWALVAFLDRMSGADQATYERVMAEAKQTAPADDGHGHRHSNEPADGARNGDAEAASEGHGEPGHHDQGSNSDESSQEAGDHSHEDEATHAGDNPNEHAHQEGDNHDHGS